jgi:hypothetical protein
LVPFVRPLKLSDVPVTFDEVTTVAPFKISTRYPVTGRAVEVEASDQVALTDPSLTVTVVVPAFAGVPIGVIDVDDERVPSPAVPYELTANS